MDTTRFCPRCNADVEDAGGFCLLGHRLSLDAPVAPMSALRAEVDRAFADARFEVESVLTATAPPPPVPVATAPPPPRPSRPDTASQVLFTPPNQFAAVTQDDPITAFAPAPRMDWGPERRRFLSKRDRRDS